MTTPEQFLKDFLKYAIAHPENRMTILAGYIKHMELRDEAIRSGQAMSDAEQKESPLFEPIWQAIKGWDIARTPDVGYAHATGDDVRTIINAIQSTHPVDGDIDRIIDQMLIDYTSWVNGEPIAWNVKKREAKEAIAVHLADSKLHDSMGLSPIDGELREQIEHMFASAWQDGVHHLNPRYLRRDSLFTDKTMQLFDTHLQTAVRQALVDFVSWYNQNYDTSYSSGIADSRPEEYFKHLKQTSEGGEG